LSKVANPLRPEQAVCQIEAQLAAQYILGLGARRPTAWIAYNDLVAVHLIRHLQAAGIRLPEQLSVVGVDDSEWCSLSSPALTSVRHPLEQMGRCAANLLIEKSEGQARSGKGKSQRIVFPPEMAVRESTAPCRT
jgi:DNA-binding LacI/PurR family transcriptional regulator